MESGPLRPFSGVGASVGKGAVAAPFASHGQAHKQAAVKFAHMVADERDALLHGVQAAQSYGARQRRELSVKPLTVCVRKRPLNVNEVRTGQFDVLACLPEPGSSSGTLSDCDGSDRGNAADTDDAAQYLSHSSSTASSLSRTMVVLEPRTRYDLTHHIASHAFHFDRCFGEHDETHSIYTSVLQPLVRRLARGFQFTCFAYGQTGSGKSYTMTGLTRSLVHDVMELVNSNGSGRGGQQSSSASSSTARGGAVGGIHSGSSGGSGRNLAVCVSYFEIYCSKVFDLLNNRLPLVLREDGDGTVQVVGLTEHSTRDERVVLELIERALQARSMGTTKVNAESSRSHSVLQIMIREDGHHHNPSHHSGRSQHQHHHHSTHPNLHHSQPGSAAAAAAGSLHDTRPSRTHGRLIGKVSMCDLAGSEQASEADPPDAQTAVEAAEINKSLLCLKECIRAMGRSQQHNQHHQQQHLQLHSLDVTAESDDEIDGHGDGRGFPIDARVAANAFASSTAGAASRQGLLGVRPPRPPTAASGTGGRPPLQLQQQRPITAQRKGSNARGGKHSKHTHIPFRGSKLTQILKDCFTTPGSSTVMIATVGPGWDSVDHTLNTLRYADRLKEIGRHSNASAAVASASASSGGRAVSGSGLTRHPASGASSLRSSISSVGTAASFAAAGTTGGKAGAITPGGRSRSSSRASSGAGGRSSSRSHHHHHHQLHAGAVAAAVAAPVHINDNTAGVRTGYLWNGGTEVWPGSRDTRPADLGRPMQQQRQQYHQQHHQDALGQQSGVRHSATPALSSPSISVLPSSPVRMSQGRLLHASAAALVGHAPPATSTAAATGATAPATGGVRSPTRRPPPVPAHAFGSSSPSSSSAAAAAGAMAPVAALATSAAAPAPAAIGYSDGDGGRGVGVGGGGADPYSAAAAASGLQLDSPTRLDSHNSSTAGQRARMRDPHVIATPLTAAAATKPSALALDQRGSAAPSRDGVIGTASSLRTANSSGSGMNDGGAATFGANQQAQQQQLVEMLDRQIGELMRLRENVAGRGGNSSSSSGGGGGADNTSASTHSRAIASSGNIASSVAVQPPPPPPPQSQQQHRQPQHHHQQQLHNQALPSNSPVGAGPGGLGAARQARSSGIAGGVGSVQRGPLREPVLGQSQPQSQTLTQQLLQRERQRQLQQLNSPYAQPQGPPPHAQGRPSTAPSSSAATHASFPASGAVPQSKMRTQASQAQNQQQRAVVAGAKAVTATALAPATASGPASRMNTSLASTASSLSLPSSPARPAITMRGSELASRISGGGGNIRSASDARLPAASGSAFKPAAASERVPTASSASSSAASAGPVIGHGGAGTVSTSSSGAGSGSGRRGSRDRAFLGPPSTSRPAQAGSGTSKQLSALSILNDNR